MNPAGRQAYPFPAPKRRNAHRNGAATRSLARMLIAAGLGAAILLTSSLVVAQDARQRAARVREVRNQMNQAVIMLRTDPLKSIQQMKRLLADYPEEKQFVYEKLGYAFSFASMPDSAMAAYKTCLETEPIRLSAARELAQLYINHGRQDQAERLFSEMLERSPNRLQAYRAVSQAQSGAGWHAQALETYHRARTEIKNPTLFALEIGDLEKMAGDPEAAIREYLLYARSAQPNINIAQDKIYELLQNPKIDRDRSLAILEEHARDQDRGYRQRVLEILAHVYFQNGLHEKALEAALESDRLTAGDGRSLYAVIQRLCNAYETDSMRKKPAVLDLCLRASDAYLLSHPRTPEAPAVHLVRAAMLAEQSAVRAPPLSRADRETAIETAVTGLDHVMKQYPGSRFAERAALLKGDIYHAHRDKEAALEIYRTGMAAAKEHKTEFAERIARTCLALKAYDAGVQHCARLIQSHDKSLAETGYYYTGVLLACMGEHEAARDTLTTFAESAPSSAYTNDAIDLAWALESGIRLDVNALEKYISVLKAEFAGDSAATLNTLEEFAGMETGTPLRPRALARLGALYADREEHEKALSSFALFLEQYPDHSLAPEIERRIGWVYEFGLGDERQALKRYEHVLMVYPAYVFLDEVRRDVVRLRAPEKADYE
jgi:tetratricopeptide (TPR) repeat protein